jgi:hypothetical protein
MSSTRSSAVRNSPSNTNSTFINYNNTNSFQNYNSTPKNSIAYMDINPYESLPPQTITSNPIRENILRSPNVNVKSPVTTYSNISTNSNFYKISENKFPLNSPKAGQLNLNREIERNSILSGLYKNAYMNMTKKADYKQNIKAENIKNVSVYVNPIKTRGGVIRLKEHSSIKNNPSKYNRKLIIIIQKNLRGYFGRKKFKEILCQNINFKELLKFKNYKIKNSKLEQFPQEYFLKVESEYRNKILNSLQITPDINYDYFPKIKFHNKAIMKF